MRERIFAVLALSAFSVMVSSGVAGAELIARYECNAVGIASQEPLGDRADHNLSVLEFSCVGVDGLLKGAVYSASNVIEWDGPKAIFLLGGGVHRVPGGRLVTQMIEGSASPVMHDGKPVGAASSGRAMIRFASDPFAALAGKTVKFGSTPVNPVRFILEFTSE